MFGIIDWQPTFKTICITTILITATWITTSLAIQYSYRQHRLESAFELNEMPRLAYFHPEFSEVEAGVSQTENDFQTALIQAKAMRFWNDEIEKIYKEQVLPLQDPQKLYPALIPIAMLGGAGNGKSSLSNSLLDIQGMVRETNDTAGGTNVVHELSLPTQDQICEYAVIAPYLPEQQIKAAIQRQCSNIFTYLNPEEKEDADPEKLERAFKSSVEFFCTLLCDRRGPYEKPDVEEFFATHQDERENGSFSKMLESQVNELISTRQLDLNRIERHEAADIPVLADVLRKVSRPSPTLDPRTRTGHPWQDARNQIIPDFNNRFVLGEEIKTEGNEEAVAILSVACESILESVDRLNANLDRCDAYEAEDEDRDGC